MRRLNPADRRRADGEIKIDRVLTFDKLTNVHFSGTRHDEDQPPHLQVHTEVCHSICGTEYGIRVSGSARPVYEIVPDETGEPRLQINASNCVHCKTCDIMDPIRSSSGYHPKAAAVRSLKGCKDVLLHSAVNCPGHCASVSKETSVVGRWGGAPDKSRKRQRVGWGPTRHYMPNHAH